ncbi:MAG TPA: FtsX-like permease family protein [Longimicrobium sp.]|uniref:ABC transporter permease n=1 Tax=Longimicrobium sp. TaxID=2029185 RepID=UPI002ED9E936
MIVSAFLRSLFRRGGRTALALAGIAVSAALLLDMTMLASGLTGSFGELLGVSGYAIRVTPRGSLPFDSEAGIAGGDEVGRRIGAVPGVRAVAPVLGAQLYLARGDSAGEPLFTTGVDPASQFLYRITSGTAPGPGQVVLSEPLARDEGLGVGDTIRLASDLDVSLGRARQTRAWRVAAVADFLYDYAGQRSVAMPIADVQQVTGRTGEVSLFGVAADAGVDDGDVAKRISAVVPEVSTYSTRELMAEMDKRLLYFQQLATILGSIALAVTALLISTIITIGVRERFGEIATLRAIGVRRRRVMLAIVTEGLVLAGAGCLIGLPLGLWMAGRLDRILLSFPGIPAKMTFFAWDAGRVALAMAIVIAVGALAGLVPGWNAARTALGRALREEAE